MDSVDSAAPSPQHGLRVVGVLGGVGSGKSTAARFLAQALAAPHLDADAEVARLFADPALLQQLDARFGGGLLQEDGSLDRAELGRRVFDDASARQALESILHPAVRRALWLGLQQAEAAATGPEPGFAVLDVPLLLENGLSKACDFLVFVEVPDALRAARAGAATAGMRPPGAPAKLPRRRSPPNGRPRMLSWTTLAESKTCAPRLRG